MTAVALRGDARPGYCTCCDLPVYSCGRSAEQRVRAEQAAARAEALAQPGVIAARFPGECGDCGDAIVAGDPIRQDDERGWVGVLCCGGGPR